uniref:Oxidoreductase family protein n=1 Tax=Rhizophora mucronata TaxID=61149 RepID=A0A2P2PMG9_RHIMU
MLTVMVSHRMNLISFHLPFLLKRLVKEFFSKLLHFPPQFHWHPMIDHLEESPLLACISNLGNKFHSASRTGN